MLKCMRAMQIDDCLVGWYTSSSRDSYLNAQTIEQQYQYQKEMPNSVVLVHDPQRTNAGRLFIKAFRLSDRTMEQYHSKQG